MIATRYKVIETALCIGESVFEGEEVVVLAAEYERLEQECERLRLDNLSKNGSIKAMGEQIAKLHRAVKNRDRMIAKAGGTEK